MTSFPPFTRVVKPLNSLRAEELKDGLIISEDDTGVSSLSGKSARGFWPKPNNFVKSARYTGSISSTRGANDYFLLFCLSGARTVIEFDSSILSTDADLFSFFKLNAAACWKIRLSSPG